MFALLLFALVGCDDGNGAAADDSATGATNAGPVRHVEVIPMGETATVVVTPPFQVLLCDETHCVDYGRVPDVSAAGAIEVGSDQGETRVFWWGE